MARLGLFALEPESAGQGPVVPGPLDRLAGEQGMSAMDSGPLRDPGYEVLLDSLGELVSESRSTWAASSSLTRMDW